MLAVESLYLDQSGAASAWDDGANYPARPGWEDARPVPRPLPPPPHPDADLAGEWPLVDFLELGALPGAVPCARLHTRHLLWEWRLTSLEERAELVVSELATNAVAASTPGSTGILPVRLWLLADAARLLILVWDTNDRPPLPADTGEDAEGGRGLHLVEAMCPRWNWYATPQSGGKTVWALCER